MRSSRPGWPSRAACSGAKRAWTASRIFAFSLLRAIHDRSAPVPPGCAAVVVRGAAASGVGGAWLQAASARRRRRFGQRFFASFGPRPGDPGPRKDPGLYSEPPARSRSALRPGRLLRAASVSRRTPRVRVAARTGNPRRHARERKRRDGARVAGALRSRSARPGSALHRGREALETAGGGVPTCRAEAGVPSGSIGARRGPRVGRARSEACRVASGVGEPPGKAVPSRHAGRGRDRKHRPGSRSSAARRALILGRRA